MGEVTTATIANTPKKKLNSDHLSVQQWIRPAIHAWQQLTSPIVSSLWNFRHRLVRYYWYIGISINQLQTMKFAVVQDWEMFQTSIFAAKSRKVCGRIWSIRKLCLGSCQRHRRHRRRLIWPTGRLLSGTSITKTGEFWQRMGDVKW